MVEKIALVVVAHMCQFERTYSGTTTLHGLEKLLRTIQPFLAEEPTANNTETDILETLVSYYFCNFSWHTARFCRLL